MLPHPSPLRERVRKYKSSPEKFGFVYVNFKWTQKLRDKIVSNKTKTIGAKNTLKPNALNIAYWI